jgi:hypothetical protein
MEKISIFFLAVAFTFFLGLMFCFFVLPIYVAAFIDGLSMYGIETILFFKAGG